MLKAGRMHHLFFGMKRAFHGTLRIGRRPLQEFGLTAARFDMLWAIYRSCAQQAHQSVIRRMLGVTAQTVSRMIKALAALGFVRVKRDEYDRRERVVLLTKLGIERIREAAKHFIEGNFARLAIEFAMGRYKPPGDESRRVIIRNIGAFDYLLGCVRDTFGDGARLKYPWHPEDWSRAYVGGLSEPRLARWPPVGAQRYAMSSADT